MWDLVTCAGGKWNSRIICVLAALGTLRYSELRKQMGNITDAVLVRPDHQGLGIAGEMIERIKERYKNYLYIEACPRIRPTSPSTSSTASGGWKTARRFKFAATAINGKSAGHRIFSAACFSFAVKGDIMGTGKVFFAKWMDVLCRWKKQRSIWKAKAAWTM